MARLVAAFGSSHSPALATTAEEYPEHEARDRARPYQLDKEGNRVSFEALMADAPPDIAEQIAPAMLEHRVAGCRAGIARVREAIAEARLDTLIVVGDDQREQYLEDNMPAILIYWGSHITNKPLLLPPDAPAYWKRAREQFHEPSQPRDYPVADALGLHVIKHLMDDGFDVSHARTLARDCGEGHAFAFVHRQLMGEHIVPILPVVLNTYFPPNQPRPARCYALGQALRRAVEAWDGDARIGIVASGGVSHFTVDEALDRLVLDACRTRDAETLAAIPMRKLNSGNSEIRNWITVAGAAERLETAWQDYYPCYRSMAGTGCGMAFAVWN